MIFQILWNTKQHSSHDNVILIQLKLRLSGFRSQSNISHDNVVSIQVKFKLSSFRSQSDMSQIIRFIQFTRFKLGLDPLNPLILGPDFGRD